MWYRRLSETFLSRYDARIENSHNPHTQIQESQSGFQPKNIGWIFLFSWNNPSVFLPLTLIHLATFLKTTHLVNTDAIGKGFVCYI